MVVGLWWYFGIWPYRDSCSSSFGIWYLGGGIRVHPRLVFGLTWIRVYSPFCGRGFVVELKRFVFILFGLPGILFHKFLIVIFSLKIHGACFSQLNQDQNYSDSLQPPKTGKDSAADILELLKNILANLSNELEYIYIMSITVIKYMQFYFVSNSA